jgi:hypothetical protein
VSKKLNIKYLETGWRNSLSLNWKSTPEFCNFFNYSSMFSCAHPPICPILRTHPTKVHHRSSWSWELKSMFLRLLRLYEALSSKLHTVKKYFLSFTTYFFIVQNLKILRAHRPLNSSSISIIIHILIYFIQLPSSLTLSSQVPSYILY